MDFCDALAISATIKLFQIKRHKLRDGYFITSFNTVS